MSTSNRLAFDWVHDLKGFAGLKAEWDALAATQVKTVFLTHNWLLCWWQYYGAGNELWTFVVRDEGVLVGIVPLMLRRGSDGLRRLEFMGAGEVTPNHLDVIARPDCRDELLRGLVRQMCDLSSRWDMVDLDKLPGDSDTQGRLSGYLKARDLVAHIEMSARCPYAELPGSIAEYLQSRGASTREDLRKKRNRLRRSFPDMRVGKVQTPEELDRAMARLVSMHQSRWIGKGYTGAFATARFIDFHRTVALRGLESGNLRFYFLELDSELAAVQYAYRAGDRVQGYLISFDERWSQYSPGMVILVGAIEQAIEEGASCFDFLEGDEEHKGHWATGVRDNVRLRVYSPGWRGRFARARMQLTGMLLEWSVRYLPVGVRRPLWQSIQRLRVSRERDRS